MVIINKCHILKVFFRKWLFYEIITFLSLVYQIPPRSGLTVKTVKLQYFLEVELLVVKLCPRTLNIYIYCAKYS